MSGNIKKIFIKIHQPSNSSYLTKKAITLVQGKKQFKVNNNIIKMTKI